MLCLNDSSTYCLLSAAAAAACLQLYGSLVGMFELNNLALAVPAPVARYKDMLLHPAEYGVDIDAAAAAVQEVQPLLEALGDDADAPAEVSIWSCRVFEYVWAPCVEQDTLHGILTVFDGAVFSSVAPQCQHALRVRGWAACACSVPGGMQRQCCRLATV